jgi:AraC-like DNA-binding protein
MTTTVPDLYRNEFTTADLAEAREFLDRTYGGRLLTASVPAGNPVLAVSLTRTEAFAVSDVALPADLTFAVGPLDQVVISTVTRGTVQVERGQDIDRYRAGDVLIGGTHHDGLTVRTYGLSDHNVILPLRLLHAVAGTEPGASAPLRFLSPRPASPAARAQWTAVTRYVDDLLANPEAALSPLVVTSAARLLAATALTVFPNTVFPNTTFPSTTFPGTTLDPDPRDRRDRRDASAATVRRGTATVRRATAFIDEHPDRDIAAADIAAAACVTVRALQMAFRRELDTTPMAYLRMVRLARAHRELLDRGPGQETVTAVAYRWGFSSASRFSAYYRETYGVTPRQTLGYRS